MMVGSVVGWMDGSAESKLGDDIFAHTVYTGPRVHGCIHTRQVKRLGLAVTFFCLPSVTFPFSPRIKVKRGKKNGRVTD